MIDVLRKAALAGGKVLSKYQGQKIDVGYKDDFRFVVTKADTESEEIIYQTIVSELSKKGISREKIGFIGEEKLNEQGDHLFVIDPLDGTVDYTIGFPYYAISIAYFYKKVLTAALVLNPNDNTIYFAEKSKGAFQEKNGQVTKLKILPQNLQKVVLGIFLIEDQHKILSYFDDITLTYLRIGSVVLELCYLATNLFGATITGNAYIWDIAASILIIEEAGGKVLDWQGKQLKFDFVNSKNTYRLVAAHPKILPEILTVIQQSYP